MSNKKLKRGVDVPPEYSHIMSKLYQCGNCKNQFIDIKVIFDGVEKLKSFPKKAREFFIFIALKKRDIMILLAKNFLTCM